MARTRFTIRNLVKGNFLFYFFFIIILFIYLFIYIFFFFFFFFFFALSWIVVKFPSIVVNVAFSTVNQ